MTATQVFNHLKDVPLAMKLARPFIVSDISEPTYDPSTQTVVAMGNNSSTCSRSSSTREGMFDFGSSDSDRKSDD